jgi:hypothetical protein
METTMNKSVLEDLVRNKKSTREIAKELGLGQTTIRYWLKKYSLETTPEKPHKCGKCGETDPNKFYGRKKKICGKCHNQENIRRGKEKIQRAIEYLGGKCINPNCPGWKYNCSLDLHHKDPNEKDPNFASKRGWRWEKLRKELDRCVLLCKNCHSALHQGEWKL